MTIAEARRTLARLRPFAGRPGQALRLRPVTSLSGRTFRLEGLGRTCALRLAGSGLADEAAVARAAAGAGIGPRVVYAGAGALVIEWLDRGAPLAVAELARGRGVPRAAMALRTLHRLAPPIARRLAIAEALVDLRRRAALPIADADFAAALATARGLARGEALCHGDAVAANLLDDGACVRFIDFEYAGRGDGLWDVAYLAADAGLGPAAEDALHAAWLGHAPDGAERARFARARALAHLVMALWGAVALPPWAGRRAYVAGHLARFAAVSRRLQIR